jgi:hypothetical protein
MSSRKSYLNANRVFKTNVGMRIVMRSLESTDTHSELQRFLDWRQFTRPVARSVPAFMSCNSQRRNAFDFEVHERIAIEHRLFRSGPAKSNSHLSKTIARPVGKRQEQPSLVVVGLSLTRSGARRWTIFPPRALECPC